MVAPVYTLLWPQMDYWPPRKTPQNDGYVYIINMHVRKTTNSENIKKHNLTPKILPEG